MSRKIRLEEKPDKNYTIQNAGIFKTVTLLKNIEEKEENGTKYWEADSCCFAIAKIEEDNIIHHFDYYWDKAEKAEKQEEIKQLQNQLNTIDTKTVRALRAIQSGRGTEQDESKLTELESKAETIRQKIQALGA